MTTTPIRIALLAGGYSGEYEVSLRSQESIMKFLESRDTLSVCPVILTRDKLVAITDGEEYPIDLRDFSYTDKEQLKRSFDFVYNTIHGTPGEDGIILKELERIGLPHSSCPAMVSALTFDKYCCNKLLRQMGYHVAQSLVIGSLVGVDPKQIVAELGLPLFIKPNRGGSSLATFKITKSEEIQDALQDVLSYSNEAIIESFLDGTEVTCGAYRDGTGIHVLPITEVVTKNAFFDYDAKYNGAVEEITPARIAEEQSERIQAITSSIYQLIGARGIIRIDYIIVGGVPFVLEINTTPGMTATSFIPQQLRANSKEIGTVLEDIMRFAIAHPLHQ